MTTAAYPDELVGLEQSICADSFLDFSREFWECIPGVGSLVENWHLELFAAELQYIGDRVMAGLPRTHDVIWNVPFGTTKSSYISVLFHPWRWVRMPWARFLYATHTDSLANDLADKAKCVVESEKYQEWFPHVKIRKDKSAKEDYANTLGGERKSCTVGGKTPTGRHAHFLGVDDPIDPQGARSPAILETSAKFMTEVLPSRMVDKLVSTTFLVQQRIDPRDPTYVMLKVALEKGATPVRHYCLPGEITDGSANISPPLEELRKTWPHAYADGLLDPVRLPRVVLDNYKAKLGRFAYSAQVLQNPTPRGGGMFKEHWFTRRQRAAPRDAIRVRYIDRAACLIAGTMVETASGSVPIEMVRSGDYVLTRQGFRRVKWAGLSGMVTELVSVRFANGSVLTGTPDHPVWDEGLSRWVDMAMLDGGSYNVCISDYHRRHPCTTSESGSENTPQDSRRCGSTADRIHDVLASGTTVAVGSRFTAPSGSSITVTSPMAIRFITRTATGTTTTSRTWSACPHGSTIRNTVYSDDGTAPRRPWNTTVRLLECGWTPPSIENTPASTAASLFSRATLTAPGCAGVVPCVENGQVMGGSRRRVGGAGSCTGDAPVHQPARTSAPTSCSRGFASCVGFSSMDARSVPPAFVVAGNAPRSNAVPVYDLQVDGVHEFFANGILVHNTQDGGCATAMVLMARDKEGTLYVEDVVHGQWEPNERNDRIVATAKKDRARYGPQHEPAVVIEAERGSTGLESFQRIAARLLGYRVLEDHPTGSKDVRAEPWSDQLAAMNVVLCDGGQSETGCSPPWDVDGFIQEHLLFKPDLTNKRLGALKDRVDASSGGCNWLANHGERPRTVRSIPFSNRSDKFKFPRLVVCPVKLLPDLSIEQRSILVIFDDLMVEDITTPDHALVGLQDTLRVAIADLDPADHQATWDDPIPPYGKPAAELVMNKDHGRKIWNFILKKRSPAPEVYVFADNADRRASSVVRAVADCLRIPRSTIFFAEADPADTTAGEGEPPLRHVFDCVKAARGMVIG